MRTINSGKRLFGPVKVCKKEIYVDTNDGTGFHEVIEQMKGILVKYSNFHHRINKLEYDDAFQDVCVFVLDGILKYMPDSGAALSSFLFSYINNRIIDVYRGKSDPLDKKNLYRPLYDGGFCATESHILEIVELAQRTQNWDSRWRNIMFRIFVGGETISDVAASEGMTRWGLTRAMRRKFKEAQNI